MERQGCDAEPVSVARTVPLFPGEVPVVGPRGFFLVGGAGSEISRPPECPREEASNEFSAAGRGMSSVLQEQVSGARKKPQRIDRCALA